MVSVRVGDAVNVPGEMHGTVKFVGPVAGKKGTFAGVQLASEYAPRGKNSGEVDGKFYFRTTIPGSGIFLPVEKAVKRGGIATTVGATASPGPGTGTPTRLVSFNQVGRTSGMQKPPNFSQSVGPAQMRTGAASPALKPPARKESLQRPSSPLRKVNTPAAKSLATPKTRPSLGMARSTMGGSAQYKPSPNPRLGGKFTQSLRQTSTTPSSGLESPLGPESSFDELPEEETEVTPTPTPNVVRNVDEHAVAHEKEVKKLKSNLEERDRQLKEQAASIMEMERSLSELQKLVPGLSGETINDRNTNSIDEDDLPRDVVSLRSVLRDKNERIKVLTAEFDNNRADFRSTIDTLEMASTETERVYEKRVDELLEEVRSLQDRSEDVESVAQQLRQLEELVQELEEGLEDARRGEAEARGEVEFLRGEVERSRSELRRERDRLRTEDQLNGFGGGPDEQIGELQAQLDSKDDEIRGLKAIIHNLNNDGSRAGKPNGNNTAHSRNVSIATDESNFSLQQQIRDLEALLQEKSAHEEELENEVTKLRSSSHLGKFPLPNSAFGMRTGFGGHMREDSADLAEKHKSSGTTGSQRTVVMDMPPPKRISKGNLPPANAGSPIKQSERELEEKRSEAGATDTSTGAPWCEMCEVSGHDILSCSNMFGGGAGKANHSHQPSNGSSRIEDRDTNNLDRPAPLVSKKNSMTNAPLTPSWQQQNGAPQEKTPTAPIEGTGDQAGMWAGKTSKVIDPDKWCALCERDGHESVDCPIEDAF